ncbi:MAG: hypothetical protein K0Q49_165 [Haloplasmataceae bacterium]|jgi:hypothetical protein|nr:hypothetical protein [Haloplasmataceae bacterium]
MYFNIVKLDPVNNYYIFTKADLVKLKKSINKIYLNQYENDMSGLFDIPVESVTTKANIPPSNDVHDYVSLATYYWPNPNTEDGFPYIQKDGIANPDGINYDKDKLRRLAYLVYHSGLLFLLTDQLKYYELLKKHCYNWFIDENTKMNPNLNFGQFIPGLVDGRAEGIIDYSANFSYALHMITLLSQFNLIETDLLNGIKSWHKSFKKWLVESEIGKKESLAQNNHGTFYDFSLLVINIFLEDNEAVINKSANFLEERINRQIMQDGSLPKETARTKSKSYTFMGLKGMLDFAELVKEFDINLLNTKVNLCVDWLYNLAIISHDSWPFTQITPFDEGINIQFIHQISKLYGNKYYNKSTFKIENIINKVPYYLFIE